MTVVIAVKVFDGVVLASDSATTLPLIRPMPGGVVVESQIYNKADKVFQLHRELPIGLATWGAGHIQDASISALAKDIRRRLMREEFEGWTLDRDDYTMEEVVEKVIRFFHDELYSHADAIEGRQPTGFLVAGYSAGSRLPEVWELQLERPDERPEPALVLAREDSGWLARGQAVAVSRLIYGIGPQLQDFVRGTVKEEHRKELDQFLENMAGPTVVPAMPFADAIDFARFCADVTVGYTRFLPGTDTVGGPIDIAAISRHEGFRWVQRKHYYPAELNPRRPHDHDQ